MAVMNNIGAITVSSNANNSGVFSGENNLPSWTTNQKRTYGFVTNGISEFVLTNLVLQNDSDLLDTPINNPNISPGAITKAL